jgi:hypothetical protein
MAKEEIEFVDGLIVKAPNPKAPDFVKAQISIKVEDLGKWLRTKYKAGDEWVNIDVKASKAGKWYAAVSNFKPKPQGGGDEKPKGKIEDMEDDIPFASCSPDDDVIIAKLR